MITNNLTTVAAIYKDFMAKQDAQAPMLHFVQKTITAAEFAEGVERITYHLARLGVKPGVRVGYTLPNCPEVFYLFIAIARLGGCTMPLFHMIPDMGKVDIFKKAGVQWVITSSAQLQSFKDAAQKLGAEFQIATVDENSASDVCLNQSPDKPIDNACLVEDGMAAGLPLLIASSSGTTGVPKLVVMTQSNIVSEIYASKALIESIEDNNHSQSQDKCSMAFPLSTSGIITLLGILFSGSALVFSAEVSPVKFIELLSRWKSRSMTAPPAFFEGILSLPMLHQFDLSHVENIYSGMDFLSPSLLTRLKDKFTSLKEFGNGYGLIETSNVFMFCKASIKGGTDVLTNVMKLVEDIGNEIDVRDEEGNSVAPGMEGELYVRGSNVVSGYINNSDETQKSFQNGWFKTGDIVRNEGNSTVSLLGRRKYLIKRGGKSVSPVVVQNHINKLEGIRESAVVGIPHPLYGEMVWAFVVVEPCKTVELKDVMKHCRTELANYMVPDQVTFVSDIPKNPGVGKVNTEKIRQQAQSELEIMNGGK